ncbi:MAG: substrate-binding domain-containing protein [Armatimonadetes bacterium]|nr:substrate-binding domain-containing protein [Armatimonadota bacterium]
MNTFARAAALVLLLVASGCVRESETESGSDAIRMGARPRPAAPGAAGKQLRIAVIPKGLGHDFWNTVRAGAEKAGQEEGVRVEWNGPEKETQHDRQIAIIENYVQSGVDAIVMAATDRKGLVPTVEKAAKRVPVITIDSGVNTDVVKTFIGTDNEKGAEAAAEELNRLLGGKGEVGVIPFIPNAATSDQREHGFKKGLARFPGLNLVATVYSGSEVAGGIKATENMLTSHPNIAGIFAANEPAAIGCARALETMGKAGQVKLVAFDASPNQIQALQKGTIHALIVQNPFKMGYEGVKQAVTVLRGETIPRVIDTGVKVVTRENLNDLEVQQLLYPLGRR